MRTSVVILICLAVLGIAMIRGHSETVPTEGTSKFLYDSNGLRDPFVPLIVPTPTITPTFTVTPSSTPTILGGGTPTNTPTDTPTPVKLPFMDLQVILAGESGDRVAIINNRIVSAGDTVGEVFIKEILPHEVVVKYLGVEFILSAVEEVLAEEELEKSQPTRRKSKR